MEKKLILGTANFGMPYGQGIYAEKLSEKTTREILSFAKTSGIATLDTAISYGDCSQRLGSIGVQDWKIITKIPKIPMDISNVSEWVENSICKSINDLGISIFEGILIHYPKDITGDNGEELLRSLENLKAKGLTRKIGVSVYEKAEVKEIMKFFRPDIVQCPVNILDTRILKDHYLLKISRMGIDVHIRSIFLQGILTSSKNGRPPQFNHHPNEWLNWVDWLRAKRLEKVEACVRFAKSVKGIKGIVIGVNSPIQLKEILTYYKRSALNIQPEWHQNLETKLLDPRKWQEEPK